MAVLYQVTPNLPPQAATLGRTGVARTSYLVVPQEAEPNHTFLAVPVAFMMLPYLRTIAGNSFP